MIRLARISALSAIVMLAALAACAPPPSFQLAPDDVILKRQQLAELQANSSRVAALEKALATMRVHNEQLLSRIAELEVRTGIKPMPTPAAAELVKGSGQLAFPRDAQRIDSRAARPRRASLQSQVFEGRGAVISFWATWCVPCISDTELVRSRELRQQLRIAGVDYINIAVDDLDKVLSHPKAGRWLYPLWHRMDAHLQMLPRQFIERIGVGLPLFLIVSRSGALRWYRTSELTPDAIRSIVNAAARL